MTRIFKDARRWLPGVIISLIFIAVLSRAVDWRTVAVALVTIDLRFLFLHGVFYFASTGSRSLASRTLLEDRPTRTDSFVIMMQGYLLNNILPFRLGELGRAYLLGRKTGLGTVNAVPAIVIERFYDLAFAALILISALPFVLSGVAWAWPVALTTLGVVLAGMLSLHFVARFRVPLRHWFDRVAGRVRLIEKYVLPQVDSFLDGLAVLMNARRFIVSLLWMTVSWLTALAAQYVLLLGFLKKVPLLYATFELGVASFGGAIPSAPSSLGIFEGSIVAALAVFGVSAGIALAFAVTHHVMHILYSGIIGMIGFSREDIGLMELYHQLTGKKQEENMP